MLDNVEAWRKIFTHMKRYFTRPVLLNRQGAAVIAVEAIFEEMDGIPRTVRLISYRSGYRFDEMEPSVACDKQIDSAPPTLNLSMVKHVFEIEADGVTFLVTIDGTKAVTRKI